MPKTDATKVVIKGKQYHIHCGQGDLAKYVLMPGDPWRVDKVGELWDNFKPVARYREYFSIRGKYKGADIACLSSGIGSPALSIAFEESIRIGVETFIRIGTCGSIVKEINCGDIIISSAAVRLDGASKDYVMTEYPAVADFEVVLALIFAAQKLKIPYHLGITASTDTFYCGQGRPGFQNYQPSFKKNLLKDLQNAKVKNFEMETACLFTLANLYGKKAGSCCVVIANRVTNQFIINKEFEQRPALIASEAVRILTYWDRLKKKKKIKYVNLDIIKSLPL
ncbi:MAG: nucleoside phosphorylase [Microgenomates group bacterium]|nr:nucleoside phosphorylase [Microgenomates group bacterium]